MTQGMAQTLAGIRTRQPLITGAARPTGDPGVLALTLLMWKLQVRRVRGLARPA